MSASEAKTAAAAANARAVSGAAPRTPPRTALVAALVGVLTTLTLARAHLDVGYVRDEAIYFEAGRRYGAYLREVAQRPSLLFDRAARDTAFGWNAEHPSLLKTLYGGAAQLLATPPAAATARGPNDRGGLWPLLREGAAMRLPAQIISGIGAALLVVAGARLGRRLDAGLLAAGAFVLLPRVAFHGGLAAFDVPVAVAILAVVLAYRRGLTDPRWGLAVGPLLGLAIACKHNALFVAPLLAVHLWACVAWARLRGSSRGPWLRRAVPVALWSAAITAPLTAWLTWPWLWRDTWARLGQYAQFHREHSYYNMEYLGQNWNVPPLPISYPFVTMAATVPATVLLLGAIGLALAWVRSLADLRAARAPAIAPVTAASSMATAAGERPDDPQAHVGAAAGAWRPLAPSDDPLDGLLLLLFGLTPVVLIALPSVPIFGGTKHFITAYPFWALAAALAWGWLWAEKPATATAAAPPRGAAAQLRAWGPAIGLVLVLSPAAWSTAHGHPYNLSQYAPLVGGARGAADLGLGRGFWGYAAPALLDELERREPGGTLEIHDLHPLAQEQYAREGRWPASWRPGPRVRARAGLLFHERHMAVDEIELWERLGTPAPAAVITLDDVPLTSLYVAPP